MLRSPRSILIVNIRLIGDVILTTPLIGLLKEAYPGAAIDLLVHRGTGEFLERDPRVRRVLYSEKGKGTASYLRTVFRSYDAAINLNASDRGTLAVLLAGRRCRVGFYDGKDFSKDFWKKRLLTHPLLLPTELHRARICELAAREIGIPVSRLEVKVFWNEQDEEKVAAVLAPHVVSAPFFVVHPFARWIYKYWKLERFAELSDIVARRYRMIPVWTSSPAADEVELLRSAAELCAVPPVLIPGKLNLNQMTCLLSRASLYLGLDTAVTHLAATVGVPMVALYGPTFTHRWFPWDNAGPLDQGWRTPRDQEETACLVVQKDMECVPCGRAGCDDSATAESPCISEVTVEELLQAVTRLLGSGEAAEPGVLQRKSGEDE